MKQIMDEKEYDPEVSQQLAQWSLAEHAGGFRHEVETLYMTEKGNYFIRYEGGIFSRTNKCSSPFGWYGGTNIQPVSPQEALAWCEETGNYETMEKYFPEYNKSK